MEGREDDDLDCHLNDPKDIKQSDLNNNRKKTIIIWISIVLIVLIIGVIIAFVIIFTIKKDDKKNVNEDRENSNEVKNNTNIEYTFTPLFNIKYGEDKIENTFKSSGANYNKKLENIIKGQDYNRNSDRNLYDLFIPENLDKNKYNK
jgi:ABC-type cobalt transport system substrate-binding protein